MMRRFFLLLLLIALALATFVWPSRWRYDHITVDGDNYLVRINRFTGHADILMPETGWIPSEQSWDDDNSSPQTDQQHT